MVNAVAGEGVPHDLPTVVDARGVTLRSAECAKVGHGVIDLASTLAVPAKATTSAANNPISRFINYYLSSCGRNAALESGLLLQAVLPVGGLASLSKADR